MREGTKYLHTSIAKTLLKPLKILAAHEERKINCLLEEAIQDLLKKYERITGRNYGAKD